MHANFRSPRRDRPRTLDGFLNAPVRPQLQGQPQERRNLTGRGDVLRSSPRTIGDFKRPEGYHAANSAVTANPSTKRRSPTDASLLHATLPGAKSAGKNAGSKASKRDWRAIRKWTLRGGLALVGVFILVGGFLGIKAYLASGKVFKGGGSAAALNTDVKPSLLKGEGDGRVNVLLLGRGGEGHAGADLTDTILVASIDPVGKKAALVSVQRDLWVSSDHGSSKINAVYAMAKNDYLSSNPKDTEKAEEAGIDALQEVVSEVLGLSIHYHAMVDFQAFKQAVDTVGGVDMNVPEELAVTERLWDPSTRKNYYLNVPAGNQHFDGQRALFFTRSRHTSTRGDFDRAERQRLFIAALSQKVLSAGTYTNPVKISQLLDAFGNHVSTDFSINDAMRLMSIGKSIGGNFDSIGLADPPNVLVRTGAVGNQSVVLPVAGVGQYDEIHTFIRSKLTDGYIVKENAVINVLNGTITPGLAAEKAEDLRTYGYNIGVVVDAPTSDYDQTILVDLTKGKKPYTRNYLEKRLGVKAKTKLPDSTIQTGQASFVIILGKNETLNR